MRRFRLHADEAARLNVSDSVRLQPGDDLAVITGVLHNLHCLVSLPLPPFHRASSRSKSSPGAQRRRRQSLLYPDYYYPNATQEVMNDRWHHDRKPSQNKFAPMSADEVAHNLGF